MADLWLGLSVVALAAALYVLKIVRGRRRYADIPNLGTLVSPRTRRQLEWASRALLDAVRVSPLDTTGGRPSCTVSLPCRDLRRFELALRREVERLSKASTDG